MNRDVDDLSGRVGCWIDALCINQNDIEERNIQVKRMSDIYSKASGAEVWLGNADNDGEKVMDVLKTFAMPVLDGKLPSMQNTISYVADSLENKSIWNLETWKALHTVLSAPYWTRLWVIQEIALSIDSIYIRYGNCAITGPILLTALNTLSVNFEQVVNAIVRDYVTDDVVDDLIKRIDRVQQLGAFRDAFYDGFQRPRLEKLLTIIQGAKQTDPKDKVYGILSLMDPGLSAMITPDYSLDASDVFFDFARAAIQSGNLDMITRARPGRIPSWVPDWTEGIVVNQMTENVAFQASKELKQEVRFYEKKLIAKGFTIDTIDGLGAKWPNEEEMEHDTYGNEIVQPSHDLNPYGDFHEALWRTLVLNRDSGGYVAPNTYAGLLNVSLQDAENPFYMVYCVLRKMNENLRIGGREFSEYFSSGDMEIVIAGMKDNLNHFPRISSVVLGRNFVITSKGFIGMGRNEAQRGDVVGILFGCSAPLILRRNGEGWELVGEAYIHGVMEGEAMEWLENGECKLEEFVVC